MSESPEETLRAHSCFDYKPHDDAPAVPAGGLSDEELVALQSLISELLACITRAEQAEEAYRYKRREAETLGRALEEVEAERDALKPLHDFCTAHTCSLTYPQPGDAMNEWDEKIARAAEAAAAAAFPEATTDRCPTCDSSTREQRNQRTIVVDRVVAGRMVEERHRARCLNPWHGLRDVELPRVVRGDSPTRAARG